MASKGGFHGPKPMNLGGAKMAKPMSTKPLFVGGKSDKMPTLKGNSHMSSASHDQFVKNVPGFGSGTKGGF